MSKNQSNNATGSGSLGDVSFIRATSRTTAQCPTAIAPSSVSGPKDQKHEKSKHHSQHSPTRPSQEVKHPSLYLHSHQTPESRHHLQHQIPQQYHPENVEVSHYPFSHSHEPSRMPPHNLEGWSDKEESLIAELEEAKIRVAQMEKTMRWWSDCTSNWREKWNKARTERNKAREDNRVLKVKLESLAKELSRVKREKKAADAKDGKLGLTSEESLSSLKSDDKLSELSEKERIVLAGANEKECESADELCESSKQSENNTDKKVMDCEITLSETSPGSTMSTFTTDLKDQVMRLEESKKLLEQDVLQSQQKATEAEENVLLMQRKLDKANNTIQAERIQACNQLKVIETLQAEVTDLTLKEEQLNLVRNELKMEIEQVNEQHKDELNRLTIDLEEEMSSRSTIDRRVVELRRELEKLQADNANEWAKRERLESEKSGLERENKKLKTQITDLEEVLERQSQSSTSIADSDLRNVQFELSEKNKELQEVKHVQNKLRKALTERTTELDHSRRRIEQYEREVQKLRSRVDELKTDLARVEDEVDSKSNAARKATRTNEELQQQVENLQVQVNHLQNRLKRNSKHGAMSTSTSLKSLTLDDPTDLVDSEAELDEI